jgi:Raf kinase inhibitor-like YbhB/YbcL family protein
MIFFQIPSVEYERKRGLLINVAIQRHPYTVSRRVQVSVYGCGSGSATAASNTTIAANSSAHPYNNGKITSTKVSAMVVGALQINSSCGVYPAMALTITSQAFRNNGPIPDKHTCKGENASPPLRIGSVPKKAASLALIVDDPDALKKTFVHWVLWNIPPNIEEIQEGSVPISAAQGLNDFAMHDYGGPCPPSGKHRYFFTLYALDSELELDESAGKAELEAAMKGHILEKAELIGLYSKK